MICRTSPVRADGALGGVHAGLAEALFGQRLVAPPFERLGYGVHAVQREAQGLAHVTHRRAGTIGDHLSRDPRPLPAVFVVDVLKDLFATLVLEINVDVRRLVALAGTETLEEHVNSVRIHRGHAQAVTDGRVGRTAAALAQNGPRPGETDDVPDGQEVRFIAQFRDQLQFVFDQPADFAQVSRARCSVGVRPSGHSSSGYS